MKSFLAIRDFVEQWYDHIIDKNSNCIFDCLVRYDSKLGTTTFKSKAMIQRSGYEDGKVSLEESGKVVSEKYHLDFSANYQDMEFDTETNSLVITGQSAKMGSYKVLVTPLV